MTFRSSALRLRTTISTFDAKSKVVQFLTINDRDVDLSIATRPAIQALYSRQRIREMNHRHRGVEIRRKNLHPHAVQMRLAETVPSIASEVELKPAVDPCGQLP